MRLIVQRAPLFGALILCRYETVLAIYSSRQVPLLVLFPSWVTFKLIPWGELKFLM